MYGTADFARDVVLCSVGLPHDCGAMVVCAMRALVVVWVTSFVTELPHAQHGTSSREYDVIHAKDQGEQWKEIKNLSMTCANIGQGPGPNESKVKQMLTETDRGRSQRAESSVIVAQSIDAFMINETTDLNNKDAIPTGTSGLVPVGLYVIMVLAHAMFAFSCKLHVMIFESAMKRPPQSGSHTKLKNPSSTR